MSSKYAIVCGITGNYAFALGNLILGFKRHNPDFDVDFHIYYQNLRESDKNILNDLANCTFNEYHFPEIKDKVANDIWFSKFSELMFSKYECFRLLEKYEKVLWLDVDMLIQGDIRSLIEDFSADIGMTKEGANAEGLFTKPSSHLIPNNSHYYNSGLILLSNKLQNPPIYADWCYKKTIELADMLKLPDQAIFNYMFASFPEIDVIDTGKKYNCHPLDSGAKTAVIIHSFNSEKLWNFYNFKEWNQNNKTWLKSGGSMYDGPKFSFICKLIRKKYPACPDPMRQTRAFFKFFLKMN